MPSINNNCVANAQHLVKIRHQMHVLHALALVPFAVRHCMITVHEYCIVTITATSSHAEKHFAQKQSHTQIASGVQEQAFSISQELAQFRPQCRQRDTQVGRSSPTYHFVVFSGRNSGSLPDCSSSLDSGDGFFIDCSFR